MTQNTQLSLPSVFDSHTQGYREDLGSLQNCACRLLVFLTAPLPSSCSVLSQGAVLYAQVFENKAWEFSLSVIKLLHPGN